MITKHQVIVNRHPRQKSEEWTYFAAFEPETPEEMTDGYFMPADLWRDMGLPETLTITVEPGDHLNDGPEYRYRDNSTGMYVSKEIAEADPDNHTKETE